MLLGTRPRGSGCRHTSPSGRRGTTESLEPATCVCVCVCVCVLCARVCVCVCVRVGAPRYSPAHTHTHTNYLSHVRGGGWVGGRRGWACATISFIDAPEDVRIKYITYADCQAVNPHVARKMEAFSAPWFGLSAREILKWTRAARFRFGQTVYTVQMQAWIVVVFPCHILPTAKVNLKSNRNR